MSALVTYSDSDDSGPDSNDKTTSILPCLFTTQPDVVESSKQTLYSGADGEPSTTEDFFNLKHATDNSNFWTTTGLDTELLPTSEDVQKIRTNTVEPAPRRESLPAQRTRVGTGIGRTTGDTLEKRSKLNVVCEIPSECSQKDQPLERPIFYPRLSLAWPLLAACVPPDRPGSSGPINLRLHKLSHSDSVPHNTTTHEPLPTLMPSSSRLSSAVCCVAFQGMAPVKSNTLHLFTGLLNGSVYALDMTQGKIVHQVDASSLCGGNLRCMAVSSIHSVNNTLLLTAGCSGIISLWDLRVSNPARPQQTFSHPGQTYSTSDLLWLTDNQFASTSDTVDRNVCDPNLSVWDTRFGRPISHQLYQERWGCSRLARRPGQLGFAVQTHGNAIVEVWGTHKQSQTSSLETHYRLERRWRYEGLDCQAHPLGLSYSSDGAFLASGCWGSADPVIWHARRTKSRQPGTPFYLRNDVIGFEEMGAMLTDVLWIPHHITSTEYAELIGIRSCGTVVIYRVHTDR